MKNLVLIFSLIAFVAMQLFAQNSNISKQECQSKTKFSGEENENQSHMAVARCGKPPIIDGVFDEGEWNDANYIPIGETKKIRLKHDNKHLYLALDGDGGNIYLNKDDKVYVFHASFSLGWLEYSKFGYAWVRDKDYEWELTNIQKEGNEVSQKKMAEYLQKNGWVMSLIPMGNKCQSEFAISFERIGIDTKGNSADQAKVPKMLISSIQNMPPSEYKGEDIWLLWPSNGVYSDLINGGKSLGRMKMDTSTWGDIYIELKK